MRADDRSTAPVRELSQGVAQEVRTASRARHARGRGAARRWMTPERTVVFGLGLLVLVVHDVGYALGQPFWVDEAWVAVTTRFPLAQLPAITSSTPIGWSMVLRVFTVGGDQTSRLLPLAFAGAAVVVAYWFARGLGWRSRDASVIAALLSGFGVLLVPAMLVRNDLKQYTADAFMALLILAVTSRVERTWSRRRLIELSAVVSGGMFVSHTAVFVGAAAFGALCLVEFARRSWGRLVETVVAGAGAAVLMVGIYVAFDARSVVPGLTAYWSKYYLPLGDGVRASMHFVAARFDGGSRFFGLGPTWLMLTLLVVGLVTIFRLGRPATSLAVVALWPGLLVVSALKKYPFLDVRTSTFLFVVTVVVAAMGVAGLYAFFRPRLKGAVSIALVALAVGAFGINAHPYMRSHSIGTENVRDQARYVAGNAAPDDVILVNLSSNWGFGYYWPIGHPSRVANDVVLQGYEAYFPDQQRIVVSRDRDVAAIAEALTEARTRASEHPGAQIWLIRTHVAAFEQESWETVLTEEGLTAVPVGNDGLSVVQVS